MKLLHRIFDFYLDVSIHVALAVFAMVQTTALIFDISTDKNFSYFLFFGTIASYNFVKYGVEAEKYILVANRYHKNIQFASLLALGIAVYHGFFLNFDTWIGVGLLVLLTGLYALPLLPHAKNLRSWGGLKIFIVALVWSGATAVLPLVATNKAIGWDVWVECVQRFVLVLVLILPFEIRDLKYDSLELKTLPQRYGIVRTKVIGALLTIGFFFLTFVKDHITYAETISKGILFLTLGMLMFVTKRNQPKYFSSFWVEAIPVFWWALLWGLSHCF